MRKFISILLCLAMVLGSAVGAFADTSQGTAATLRLEKTEGKVSITKTGGKSVTVKEGTRLYDGYEIKTDTKSAAYVSLDSSKAIMLDASTNVAIKKNGKKLEIMLKSGTILVNVEDKLKSDEELNIRTTNSVTGIRGTILSETFNQITQNTEVYLFEGQTTGRYQSPDGTWYEQTLQTGNWLASGQGMLKDNPQENGWKQEEDHWIYTNNDIEGAGASGWCWSEEKGWYTESSDETPAEEGSGSGESGETGESGNTPEPGEAKVEDGWIFRFTQLQPKVQEAILLDGGMLEKGQEHLDLYPELAEDTLDETNLNASEALTEQQEEIEVKATTIEAAFEAGNGGEGTVDNLFEGSVVSEPTYVLKYLMGLDSDPANDKVYMSYYLTEGSTPTTPADPTRAGYTFAGWDQTLPAKMPAAELVLTATWTENKYTISYDLAGGTSAAISPQTDIAYTNLVAITSTVPTRDGYDFTGWSTVKTPSQTDHVYASGETLTAALSEKDGDNVTLYAQWKAKDYSVTLNANGGTIATGNVTSYTYGVEATLPTAVNKDGYVFAGWFADSGLTGSAVTAISTTDFGDKTYYAKWTEATYTVTLNTNDGTIATGKEVTAYTYGTGADLPTITDMKKTGYLFAGWYDNASFTGSAVTAIGTAEFGDKTYYANWTAASYNVTLNTNDGTIATDKKVTAYTYGTGVTLPTAADVTKANYTFAGWYDNKELNGSAVTAITTTDLGDKEYYAKWDANAYSVTLNTNGGSIASGKEVTTYTYGTGATLPTTAEIKRTGYTFAGWYATSDFSDSVVTAVSTTDSGAKTYYAKWDAITYSVTYDNNDSYMTTGTTPITASTATGTMRDSSLTYDVAANLTANAYARSGYTFAGWNTQADGMGTAYTDGQSVTNLTATAGDTVTLYAQWTANTYSVTYDNNDSYMTSGTTPITASKASGTMAGSSFTYDLAANLTANAYTRSGYTFTGWNTQADGKGTVYYTDGQSVTNLTATAGDTITLYAQWEPITYTITFAKNNDTAADAINDIGVTVTDHTLQFTYDKADDLGNSLPDVSGHYELTGYTGSGWSFDENATLADIKTGNAYTNDTLLSDIQSTVAANADASGNATLYVIWSPNTYSVVYDNNAEYMEDFTDFVPEGAMAASTFNYDNAANLTINSYTLAGYNFTGWNEEKDGTGTSYTDGQSVKNLRTADGDTITLYAQWTAGTYALTIDGTYANGTTGYGIKDTASIGLTETTAGSYIYTANVLGGAKYSVSATIDAGDGILVVSSPGVEDQITDNDTDATRTLDFTVPVGGDTSVTVSKVALEDTTLVQAVFSSYTIKYADESMLYSNYASADGTDQGTFVDNSNDLTFFIEKDGATVDPTTISLTALGGAAQTTVTYTTNADYSFTISASELQKYAFSDKSGISMMIPE